MADQDPSQAEAYEKPWAELLEAKSKELEDQDPSQAEAYKKPWAELLEAKSKELEGLGLGDTPETDFVQDLKAAGVPINDLPYHGKFLEFLKPELLEYDMSSETEHETRGTALIINNRDFSNGDVRVGTDIDRNALDKLWKDLHFETDVKDNVTGQEMIEMLKNLAKDPRHTDPKCVVICILSHGGDDTVCGCDNVQVPIDYLVELFHNDKVHPSLRCKPKMFFIQACRGKRETIGVALDAPPRDGTSGTRDSYRSPWSCCGLVTVTESRGDSCGDREPPQKEKPHAGPADILVCYSTAPDHLSKRNEKTGSWYIYYLVKVFRRYCNTHRVMQMMVMVNGAMGKEPTGSILQAPSFRAQLRKEIFLRPRQPV